MARGFSAAPGASAELAEASAVPLERPRMLVLGTSKNGLVRTAIAERDDCPFGLMVTLAHDYSASVRQAVAANPRTQRSVLQYLTTDRAVPVALALINNPSLPQELLEELVLHKKSEVRAAAKSRLEMGIPSATDSHSEDEHTPELAEHGSLALDMEWSLGSDVWTPSTEGLVTAPDAGQTPTQVVAEAPVPAVMAPTVGASDEEGLPSPSWGERAVGATRTAPVRGFRAPRV